MKLTNINIDSILEEIRTATKKQKLTEEQFQQLTDTIHKVLENYQKEFPDDTDVNYSIRKRLGRCHVTFFIPGKELNPFEESSIAPELNFIKKVNALVYKPFNDVNYYYGDKTNVVTITIQNNTLDLHVLTNPMFLAAILGLILGLACHQLPGHVSTFLAKDVADPILIIIIDMMSGVMGPVIFISLVTSITTLDSINELNNQGIRFFRRFLHIALFITALSILMGIIIFPVLGKDNSSFDRTMLVNLFLSIFPTNIFSPFVDNNFPQLAILGLLMGAALLIISKKTPVLPSLLTEVSSWLYEIMDLVFKLMPAVPFLSLFTIAAEGKFHLLMKGWKFIAATYLGMLIFIIMKIAKVSVKCKIGPASLLRKMKPLIVHDFFTGNEMSAIGKFYDISKNGFHIDPDFTSFWFPLSAAMFAPYCPVGYVLACFTAAEFSGTPVSPEFLLIMSILTIQLTLATPGLIPGITILFKSLGLPKSYIGPFSAFNIFLKNGFAVFNGLYRMLEEVETASAMGHIIKEDPQQITA